MAFLSVLDTNLFFFFNKTCTAPWLDWFMLRVTDLGNHRWIFAIMWIAWMFRADKKGRQAGGIILAIVLLCDVSVSMLLKPWLGRPRPYFALDDVRLLTDVSKLTFFGFPSNHAANSAAAGVFVGMLSKKIWVRVLCAVAVLLSAWSRVYIGVHYPMDVAAGILYGSLLSTAGVLLVRKLSSRAWEHDEPLG